MILERHLLNGFRDCFPLFAIKAFNIINPGQTLHPTLAFLAISQKLADVAAGRIRRLLINVPPRAGKSLLASIAFPAFVLGHDPTRRIICASYSGELAAKLARDCRMLMQHSAYRQLFPATVITGKNTESEVETAYGGFRYSTSVGGTLTGRGGNFIVIDDPTKPEDAMSALARDRVWEWYTGTLGSRLDNKAEDSIIVVMQRLHVDDLSGRLLEQQGWDHLSIPAIATNEQTLDVGNGRMHVRAVGDVLDPDREPLEVLNRIREELGSSTFEAQYQQQPIPEEGGLLKWSWFSTYDVMPRREAADIVIISWDTALKDREINDYSIGIVGLVKPNSHVFVLDVVRERMEFPALMRWVQEQSQKHHPCFSLIEDTGSGTVLLQSLRGLAPTIPMRPIKDKVVRLQAVSPYVESGQVHLPARAPWLDTFKRELLSFPRSGHDDQVDAFTQLLAWVKYRASHGSLQSSYSAR